MRRGSKQILEDLASSGVTLNFGQSLRSPGDKASTGYVAIAAKGCTPLQFAVGQKPGTLAEALFVALVKDPGFDKQTAKLRSQFCKDFGEAAFATLVKELRAEFGGEVDTTSKPRGR